MEKKNIRKPKGGTIIIEEPPSEQHKQVLRCLTGEVETHRVAIEAIPPYLSKFVLWERNKVKNPCFPHHRQQGSCLGPEGTEGRGWMVITGRTT